MTKNQAPSTNKGAKSQAPQVNLEELEREELNGIAEKLGINQADFAENADLIAEIKKIRKEKEKEEVQSQKHP
ncbi:MAG: hypothetical protein LBD75_07390 [Candidatus Peribacteria bacterium]|jgi:hypothetical protein|nr:hypothetical protein [Candidatus Peribacteria bacterium]